MSPSKRWTKRNWSCFLGTGTIIWRSVMVIHPILHWLADTVEQLDLQDTSLLAIRSSSISRLINRSLRLDFEQNTKQVEQKWFLVGLTGVWTISCCSLWGWIYEPQWHYKLTVSSQQLPWKSNLPVCDFPTRTNVHSHRVHRFRHWRQLSVRVWLFGGPRWRQCQFNVDWKILWWSHSNPRPHWLDSQFHVSSVS